MPSPNATIDLIDLRNLRRFRADRAKFWEFQDPFAQKPILESDLDWDPATTPTQAEFRLTVAANRNFKVSGTNMTSALATLSGSGGITLTTAGANNDQALLNPATVNSAGTYLSSIGGSVGSSGTSPFLSAKQFYMRMVFSLSSVAAVRFVAGFKQTTTPTLATDNDQAYIGFDTAHSTAPTLFRGVTSVGGTDTDTADSGSVAVAASTNYNLEIIVDENRRPLYFINERNIATGPALTTPMAYWPVVGIQALTGAAKAITIRHIALGRIL